VIRVERWAVPVDGDAVGLAARTRALAADHTAVSADVAAIIAAVAERGDAAVAELTRRLDLCQASLAPARVAPEELSAALAGLSPELRAALSRARDNVAAVAQAGLSAEAEVELAEGHRIRLRQVPVRRAAVYVPGGRAPYPSTVIMGVTAARVAGVDEVVVCTPPSDAGVHPAILGACELCRVTEVWRMGGAQAVAAVALGTETVVGVDVVVGPGNLWVQEAKRQLAHRVGIDGFAGPTDLLIVASSGARPRALALDLLAQAEHGPETVVALVSDHPELLKGAADAVTRLAADRPTAQPAAVVLVAAALQDGLAFAEAFAPEHLQLVGSAAEALAPQVRSAGCLLVGTSAATAFGDYIAGSNHVLPTAGAARFASALSPAPFRRRMAEVRIEPDAAGRLAGPGAAIARAEGFVVHAESMQARAQEAEGGGAQPGSRAHVTPR